MRDMTPGDFENAHAFSFEQWSIRSRLRLVNVPWSSDYQDVVRFDNASRQSEYFNGLEGVAHTIERATYCRPGEPVRISLPFYDAYRFNYLTVDQRQQSVGERPRVLYYFIQDVRHIAPNTTELTIMLDVWQTFQFDVQLGRAYVEQGHVGIAQKNNHADYGRQFLMEPEGLETGAEMVTLSSDSAPLGSAGSENAGWDTARFDILVWSNTSLHGDYGTVPDPKMTMAKGGDFQSLPQSASCYLFKDANAYQSFLSDVDNAPWVTQGIIAVHVIPNGLVREEQLLKETYKAPATDSESPTTVTGSIYRVILGTTPVVADIKIGTDFRSIMRQYRGDRYKYLDKFLTAPYSSVEITTYTGAPLTLRPECIYSSNVIVRRFADLGLPSPRLVLTPLGYNFRKYDVPKINESWYTNHGDGMVGDFLDVQTGIYNFPTLSILNNSYLAYMSSNAHSIAFQHSAADWSQQKALTGNQLSFDQSTAGIALNSEMNRIGNEQQITGTAIGATAGIAGGVAAGSRAGIGGALLGGASAAMGQAANVANTANSVYHNNQRTNAGNANSAYMRDTNKAYADFSARGDYAQSIAAINAKAQDMRAVAPTTVGQVGGEQFALMYLQWHVFSKVKMIQPANLRAIGEYWLRYGYKINRPINFGGNMARLSVMSEFTYWRLSEVYIRASNCPEAYRMSIRGILTKGVTVWNNPESIGFIDPASNTPIPGDYII